jgi:hypothetical protein
LLITQLQNLILSEAITYFLGDIMSEINDYKKVDEILENQIKNLSTKEKIGNENYMKKHLLEIQNELDNEIVNREKFEQFLGLVCYQCTNYTLSMFLISLGMEIWISTLIGLFIALIPAIGSLLVVAKLKNYGLFKYLSATVNVGAGLLSSAVIITSITIPHIASKNTIKEIYREIKTVEHGQSHNKALINLQKSPITPLLIVLLLIVTYITLRKK